MISLVFLILILQSFGDARLLNHEFTSNIGSIEDKIHQMYGNNLTNFEKTLALIDSFDGSVEKIAAFKALVGAMKDSDHLYSQEIMQFADKFKEFVAKSDFSKKDQEQLENIKNILPESVKAIYFCSSFKLKQIDINQYLMSTIYVHDKDRRYVFFGTEPQDVRTDFKIVKHSNNEQGIVNVWSNEYLCPTDAGPDLVVLWMGDGNCYSNSHVNWAIEMEIGTPWVKFKTPGFNNAYMYDSGDFIKGGRVPKKAKDPKRHLWHLICSENI